MSGHPRLVAIRLVTIPALLVASLLAAAGAGCASGEAAPEAPRIRGRPVAVMPVLDRSGALAPTETAALTAEITAALRDIDEKRPLGRPAPRAFPVVETPTADAIRLEVVVTAFDAEGSVALGLVVGLGAGRPGYEVDLRLTAPATVSGAAAPDGAPEALGERSFERARRHWSAAPGAERGTRGAMLREIVDVVKGFVARRR